MASYLLQRAQVYRFSYIYNCKGKIPRLFLAFPVVEFLQSFSLFASRKPIMESKGFFTYFLDIDIGTKHRLVAFKRPLIFLYFDSHCRFMDTLAAKFQY